MSQQPTPVSPLFPSVIEHHFEETEIHHDELHPLVILQESGAPFSPNDKTVQKADAAAAQADGQQKYKTYTRRWLQLIVFCILSALNAMAWSTFSPIATTVKEFYDIGSLEINWLSMVFMALYFASPIASYILDSWGLRPCLYIGAILQVVGAGLRVAGIYTFWLLFVGQSICALAQCFILNIPMILALNWFPERQRSTAVSIGIMFNYLGSALAFAIFPFMAGTRTIYAWMLGAQAIASGVACVLILIVTRSRPPSPPSEAAAAVLAARAASKNTSVGIKAKIKHETKAQLVSLWNAIKNGRFWVVVIAFAISQGDYYVYSSLLEQFLTPRGYSETAVAVYGFIIIISGMIFLILTGLFIDKTKWYLSSMKVGFVGLCFSVFATSACIFWADAIRAWNVYLLDLFLLGISLLLFGVFSAAVIPITMGYAIDITMPLVTEAQSTIILLLAAQLAGIIQMSVIDRISQITDYGSLSQWVCYLVTLLSTLPVLLLFSPLPKPKPKDPVTSPKAADQMLNDLHPIYHVMQNGPEPLPSEPANMVFGCSV